MGKVTVTEFVSLDGIFEDPGGAESYVHGGWTRAYWDDDIAKFKNDELFAADAQLLGRITYQGFAAAWPGMEQPTASPEENTFAHRMNSMPKFVASTTLKTAEWTNSTIIKGNVPDEVARLKQTQNLLIAGSGQLVQSLHEHNLIDEYRLLIYPVVLGTGKRLFQDSRSDLKLVESHRTPSGIIAVVYHRSE